MFRFFATCLVLAAGCVAAVIYVSEIGGFIPKLDDKKAQQKPAEGENPAQAENADNQGEEKSTTTRYSAPDRPVRIIGSKEVGKALPIILQDGHVMPMERREVPSERDGKLLLLATPVPDEEFVPSDKLERLRVSLLGVEWKPGDEKRIAKEREFHRRPAIKEPFTDPDDVTGSNKQYRLPLPGDTFAPGTTKIIRLPIKFRRLSEDDEVQVGQLIGIINPAEALEKLAIQQAKIGAADAEVGAARALKEESIRRYQAMAKARQISRGAVSDDDFYAGKVTIDRYVSEEVAKRSAVVQAQQELSGAWTSLDLFFIRAPISGRIRTIYRKQGEAVKNLEAVLQLQNTRRLRVEAQVELQDALPLKQRVRLAEKMRKEAKRLQQSNPTEAEALRKRADEVVRVQAEITQPVSPMAILPGHLQEVTCVAVSGEQLPRIVSGSEEGVVRIWERVPGEDRWHDRYVLDHGVPIRAVACSHGKGKDLLITGTSRGMVRIFDLANLSKDTTSVVCGKDDDSCRHQGAVNTIAINAEGTLAATAGEDRKIILWNLPSGEVADVIRAAHNSHVTWVGFTPKGELVSASRDKALKIWEQKDGKWTRQAQILGRSGEVATLSINPKTDSILYDADRELRVLSLEDQRIEGVLVNPGASGAFSTMALFAPDGKTILTNGNGPGRLQLWRAPSDNNRAAELRQFLWTTGTVTCGAFDPNGEFAVTGTSDHRVLVWKMPRKEEAEKPSDALLTYVEENLDSGLKRVTVRATITNPPEDVHPGSPASIVVPPRVR